MHQKLKARRHKPLKVLMQSLLCSAKFLRGENQGRATLLLEFLTLTTPVTVPSTSTWLPNVQIHRHTLISQCLTSKWISAHTKTWLSTTLTRHSHSQVSNNLVLESNGKCPREIISSWMPSSRKSSMINLLSQMQTSYCINLTTEVSTLLLSGNAAFAISKDFQRIMRQEAPARRRRRKSEQLIVS